MPNKGMMFLMADNPLLLLRTQSIFFSPMDILGICVVIYLSCCSGKNLPNSNEEPYLIFTSYNVHSVTVNQSNYTVYFLFTFINQKFWALISIKEKKCFKVYFQYWYHEYMLINEIK